MLTRRDVLLTGSAVVLGGAAGGGQAASNGPVRGDWQSLASVFHVPEWFRDAKFGIWAHWGPQCQPEHGDWYARLMYMTDRPSWMKGETAYEHHLKHYGHPSQTGFLDIIGQWKAEKWDPEYLVRRYAKAGARYFFAMANHHDNLDLFDSKHHGWNSVRVGPKKDILRGWEKVVRQTDLKFGISNHAAHAWHWYQTAYGYDPEGPMRGRRYDAYWRRKHHGKGTFWEGLDPQELYTGPSFVAPPGITTNKAMAEWHDKRDGQWIETVPPANPEFVRKWLLRQNQIVDDYRPDLIYFDNTGLPLEQAGLDATAHYYNQALARGGKLDVAVFGKKLEGFQRRAIIEDVERGVLNEIRAEPWQTCTCIGSWHYSRGIYRDNAYKPAKLVVQMLSDIVSKNGNLLLSIPVRGDGTIDEKEEAIVDQIAAWNARNGEAIFGTRPWTKFGEGPTQPPPAGAFGEEKQKPYTARDVRFTKKGDALYAIFLDWPQAESAIASLGSNALPGAAIERVDLIGGPELQFRRDADALRLTLPGPETGAFVPVIRIRGRGLV
ncbi:alpha-L-fucosidase [Sphingomonas sp. DT-207]|uniref:alpha-L-fucosidase n=1 Tax=Sphingomonas sp. DT-207 TaxID=3396167 RepID=UPI003F198888